MIEHESLGEEEPDMASVQLAFELESEHTRNSYKLDMSQESLGGKTQAVA